MASQQAPARDASSVAGRLVCIGCPHHTQAAPGCRVVAVGSSVRADAFLARDRCYLRQQLHRFANQWLSRQRSCGLDSDDIAQQAALLILGAVRRGIELPRGWIPFLGYLRRLVRSGAISLLRREHGRVRCGSCRSYSGLSGTCTASGPWRGVPLPRTQDPRQLQPPCSNFAARRDHVRADLDGFSSKVAGTPEERLMVRDALQALVEAHPRAARVVRGRLVDGRSYDELGDGGLSLRTLKRDYALGIRFLRGALSGS